MSVQLPGPLLEYVLRRVVGERAPAYMLISKGGAVIEWGGEWEAYGVRDLERGRSAAAQIDFLGGALPLGTEPLVLSCVALHGERAADVHLVPGSDADWLLLLDASTSAKYQQIGQQAANELALLREAYEKLRRRATVPPNSSGTSSDPQ